MNKKKISKKKIRRILVAVIVILVIIFAAVYTLFIQPNQDKEKIIYTANIAESGVLRNEVTESGTVTFGITTQNYELDITTETEDDDEDEEEDEEEDYLRVEEVYVAVGQRIQKGDAIYKFSDDSIADVRKALTYAKTEAQIALLEAQTNYSIGTITAGLSKEETLLSASLAQQEYDNTISKLISEMSAKTIEIEQLLADIYEAQFALVDEDYREQRADLIEQYEDAMEELEEVSEEYVTNRVDAHNNFLSVKASYESFFEAFDKSTEEIEAMVDQVYELQEEILHNQQLIEKDLLTANQKFESASMGTEIADLKYQSDLSGYENALVKAEETLQEAQDKLDAFETFVGDGIVYATGAGIITELGYAEDDYLITTGTLISYACADDMTISVDVSQEDVVAMKVGDKVEITFAAYEDEVYEGIVESITTTATSRSSATISYPVVIAIQGDTSKLYGGMTADITFVTDETQEVVYVSRKAIVEQNGKKYIYKKQGNEYVLSPVTTGFTAGQNVAIESGLEVGETYYMESVVVEEEN